MSQNGCAGAGMDFFFSFSFFFPLELLKETVLRFKVSLQQISELCACMTASLVERGGDLSMFLSVC